VRPVSSSERSAVIREPERSVASTTMVIALMAAMIRLRAGKCQRAGRAPNAASEMAAPPSRRIVACRLRALGGYATSAPPARTATVCPPASSAPRCAAVSIPKAMPLTTTRPAAATEPASSKAIARP
jgi:hypothetical protein